MSAVTGIYNLDGRPADLGLLHRMVESSISFGPDRTGRWIDGPIALGHCGLWTVEESRGETQPRASRSGDCRIVCDGRVDNRGELIRSLDGHGVSLQSPTDAELILEAYNIWGTDCASKIVGDFAFVIWDESRRRLFCARDQLGVRPFFYSFDGKKFLCGSVIRQLLQDRSIARGLDEEYIADYIARGECPSERTPYRSIKRLLGGWSIVIENGRLRKHQYWNFDPNHEIRYSTDEEYEEHFRTVFLEAVRAHLRSSGPIYSELSGGLDSSSIVCASQEIYRAGEAENRGFTILTDAYDESKKADEKAWSKIVTDKYGLDVKYFPADQYWVLKDLRRSAEVGQYRSVEVTSARNRIRNKKDSEV